MAIITKKEDGHETAQLHTLVQTSKVENCTCVVAYEKLRRDVMEGDDSGNTKKENADDI
jgi:hypothetical protein